MPTVEDWKELDSLCYWVWTNNYNGTSVAGYIIYKAKSEHDKGRIIIDDGTPSVSYSLSDAHIFLPAAGWRNDSGLNSAGFSGNYWSSSLDESKPSCARNCDFSSRGVGPSMTSGRFVGLSVRPVKRP